MKLLFAGLIAASTVAFAAPSMAQRVYVGPSGVGLDIGARPYGGHFRDRDDYYGRRPMYEGRSAYRLERREFRDDRY